MTVPFWRAQLKYLLEQKENNQYNRKPMSGFFAVFFALNMCDRVSLYGFDAYTSKKRSYRYHYFDNVQGFTDVHSFDLALEGARPDEPSLDKYTNVKMNDTEEDR
eukprot:1180132-Prorocentrum_minimum.AAC.1